MEFKQTALRNHLWVLTAIFCTMLWGSASPVIKLGYEYFNLSGDDIYSILLFAGIRFFGAGWMALLLSIVINKKIPRFYKGIILPGVTMALTQTIFQYIFFYIGMLVVSGAAGALISSSGTFFTVIIAVFLGYEMMTSRKLFGIILGMAGIIVLNLSSSFEFNFRMNGEFLILLSAICYALFNILVKKFSCKHDPITLTSFQFLLGGTVLSLIGLLGGGRIVWPGFQKGLLLVYLMFVAAMGYSLWAMLLKRHDASKIVIFHTLTPVFGALFAWILLDENIWRWNTLASLFLIAFGISLINLKANNCAPEELNN